MSDYREIEIIVNVFGKDNIMTYEQERVMVLRIRIAVSESVTLKEVTEEVRDRLLAIEDEA